MRRNSTPLVGARIRALSYCSSSTNHASDLNDILDFLEKPGCHLCEAAFPIAERLARRTNVPLRRIDIRDHDQLIKEFSLRIPVLRLGETVLDEGAIEYRTALAAARRILG